MFFHWKSLVAPKLSKKIHRVCLVLRLEDDTLKLSYFELLSTEPIKIQNIGSIASPRLRDIASLGYHNYQYYLSVLLLNAKTYLSSINGSTEYGSVSDEELTCINIFDLLTSNEQSRLLLKNVLNFFIKEDVEYSPGHNAFLIKNNGRQTGAVTRETYPQICDLICRLNCVKPNAEEDLSKTKSKKALEIMKKLQKGRAEKAKRTKADRNMELGNIISAVANKSQSLNIINIWDLTVFQLWDCFSRLSNNNIYDIQSMSVAAWGDKDNRFDADAWFRRMDAEN